MKLHRAIEKIASVSRTEWVSIEACDLSKKLAEDLEHARLAETRWEYPRGGRREMFVRLTDAGRAELVGREVDPVAPLQRAADEAPRYDLSGLIPEPSGPRDVAVEFHEDDRGSLRMGPAPSDPVVEIVEALRHGDLDTHPIVVDMHSSRAIADAIWKRWGER